MGKKNKRRNDVIDKEYSQWLGTKPCLITGKKARRGSGLFDIHCHHVEGRGLGQDDHKQVPLLGSVHNDLHSMGASDFVEKYKGSNKDLQNLQAETSYDMAREIKEYLRNEADRFYSLYIFD